jgi:predicted patatin/cPLA2 family phospholipase
MSFDTICLSGGGTSGIIFIGTLKYLQKKKFINLSLIQNWVGTSIGAVICFLFTLNYNIEEIIEFILEFNFKNIDPEMDIENILEYLGFNDGFKIMFIITNFLIKKYDLNDITFDEHYKLTNKKLTIIGTNFSKGIEGCFNYLQTPNMSVITALRISISIPIIFTPVLYNNDYYVDGAIINNFPINKCNITTTLGIYIKYSCCNKMNNLSNIILGCISIFSDTVSLKDCPINTLNIIEINNKTQNLINFNFNKESKLELFKIGKNYGKNYIKNINENICRLILQNIINNIF